MKKITKIIIATIVTIQTMLLFNNYLTAQTNCEKTCSGCKPKYKQQRKKSEFLFQGVKRLKQEGIISDEEEKELLGQIEELKKYRKEVWADDKLTKDEEKNLREKEKTVRDKIRTILERSKEHFMEDKSPKEREELFNKRVDNMLKKGIISKQQADELKANHKELLKLEEEIWSDGAMTRQEQKKLIEQRRKLNEKINKTLGKEFKKRRNYKKGELPHPHFEPERGHFLPEERPIFPKDEFFEEKI